MAEGGPGDQLDAGEPLAASSRASTVTESATNTFLVKMDGENWMVDASPRTSTVRKMATDAFLVMMDGEEKGENYEGKGPGGGGVNLARQMLSEEEDEEESLVKICVQTTVKHGTLFT